jgi:drug/metabolite transporter (DMT)-like permease
MHPIILVYAELLTVALMWSHAPVLIKFCLRYVSPWDLVVIRHVPAAIVFAIMLLLSAGSGSARRMLRADGWRILIVGSLGVTGYHFSLNTGQQYIPAGTAALIIGMVPLFTFILAAIALGERPTITRGVGIAIAFAGLYVCVRFGGGTTIRFDHIMGVLITLMAPVFAAFYTTFSRSLARKHGAVQAAAATIILGTLPLLTTIRPSTLSQLPALPGSFWAALLFLSLGCTVLGYILWAHALRRLEATNVAVFLYIIPLLGLLWGYLYLGEMLSVWILLGAALIITGVALTNWRASDNMSGPHPPA